MVKPKRKRTDFNNLVQLMDYSRYLYELENQRNEKLTSVTNIYLVVITFAFSFFSWLFSVLPQKSVSLLFTFSTVYIVMIFVGFVVSALLIFLALIFTFLVVKVRSFERLCDPKSFVTQTVGLSRGVLIGSIISNYVVATERNILLNDKKAAYLSYALQAYIVGFVVLLTAAAGIFAIGR